MTIRSTLAQEAQEKMNDARAELAQSKAQEPSDEQKVKAYQVAAEAVMDAAAKALPQLEIGAVDYATLRYVGEKLVEQGFAIKFDFSKCALVAKWG